MPLKLNEIKSAAPKDKDYKLYDEKGLFLLVKPSGAKYWRMKYTLGGKEKLLAIGVYPEVTLSEARDRRDEARAKIKDGIDPMAQRAAAKAAPDQGGPGSFEAIAREWFALRTGKAPAAEKRILARLENDCFPYIGHKQAAEVTRDDMQELLARIVKRGSVETAHRVKRIVSQIYKLAIITGRATFDPAEHLEAVLPVYKPEHFAAITDPLRVGQMMNDIDHYRGGPVVRAALQLQALWFMRPGELRATPWEEVNWDELRLEVPKERTKKSETDLLVPISRQAEAILRELHPLTGGGRYLFPNPRGAARCMSENALRAALRSMGYSNDDHTPHGFRATARTLLAEELEFPDIWIEQQLNHSVKDVHGRAYNRTQFLRQRREMMQRWADYLDELREKAAGRNVVAGHFKTNI